VKANYLASPPLVVAVALAGTTDIDLTTQPLGRGRDGVDVYLRDLWPTDAEVERVVRTSLLPDQFERAYADVFVGSDEWQAIRAASDGAGLYAFDDASTYIREPPFLADVDGRPRTMQPLRGARVLAVFGDSVTTDHISPAGDIDEASPAGRLLRAAGVARTDFNSYGARRGNDRVMVRGTFANIRLRNLMVPGVEGGVTRHVPSGDQLAIFDAAERYRAEGTPLVLFAGSDYGMGSSRDWAAKGTALLGVRAVIAESLERIHRANLVGMGVLPLTFEPGVNAAQLGLSGVESVAIDGVGEPMQPRQRLTVHATRADGSVASFPVLSRLDTPADVRCFEAGGILPLVLRRLMNEA
jgi:aconitate hydratase